MSQQDRARLVVLREVQEKRIRQREAAETLGVSVRQVQRLLEALKGKGDQAVVHGLAGKPSNRGIAEEVEKRAVGILSGAEYWGFGPTLASEYLASKHEVEASRETVRQWMMKAGLWKAGRQKIEQVHPWRARRSRFGELVQWDTSEHAWLEGRGPVFYLIGMIDDASSRALARFVASDSTEANMGVLELWLRRYGRMRACYTDKAGLFQTAPKTRRDEQRGGKDREPMPPTQIGRALQELSIAWIAAHSPQAKGRIERFFETAQDRLIKGMRVAGVKTIEQGNEYLEKEYLPWWEQTCTVAPANGEDAHQPLEQHQDLAAILSHVESRQVKNDYTIQFEGKLYGIERTDICSGLRGSAVRVEKRRDGTVAIQFQNKYLRHEICERAASAAQSSKPAAATRSTERAQCRREKPVDEELHESARAIPGQSDRDCQCDQLNTPSAQAWQSRHLQLGMARRQSSPATGKLSKRPAATGRILNRLKRVYDDAFPAIRFPPPFRNPGRPGCVF